MAAAGSGSVTSCSWQTRAAAAEHLVAWYIDHHLLLPRGHKAAAAQRVSRSARRNTSQLQAVAVGGPCSWQTLAAAAEKLHQSVCGRQRSWRSDKHLLPPGLSHQSMATQGFGRAVQWEPPTHSRSGLLCCDVGPAWFAVTQGVMLAAPSRKGLCEAYGWPQTCKSSGCLFVQ